MLGLILVLIFIISFILALRSMKDFELPKEVRRLLRINRIAGKIIIMKNKIKHYRVK